MTQIRDDQTWINTYNPSVFFWHSTDVHEGIPVCFVEDQLWGGTLNFLIVRDRKNEKYIYEHWI